MIEVALKRPVAANLRFSVANLTSFKHPPQFRAIPCRGVLNDFLTDEDRERVTRQFAALLADVRDWLRTVARYRARPRTIQAIDLPNGGRLTFHIKAQRRSIRAGTASANSALSPTTLQLPSPHYDADARYKFVNRH